MVARATVWIYQVLPDAPNPTSRIVVLHRSKARLPNTTTSWPLQPRMSMPHLGCLYSSPYIGLSATAMAILAAGVQPSPSYMLLLVLPRYRNPLVD